MARRTEAHKEIRVPRKRETLRRGLPDYSPVKAALNESIAIRSQLRWEDVYKPMTPLPGDSKETITAKQERCIVQLKLWSKDPIAFIEESMWAPDPRNAFGASSIPEGFHPPRMVPILIYPEQRRLVENFMEVLDAEDPMDLNLIKSRQVAATTYVLALLIWCFLFRPGFKALLGSYSEDAIDGGGKGHREGDSLFARLRMMMDAFVGNVNRWGAIRKVSHLCFNQQWSLRVLSGLVGKGNPCVFGSSDDTRARLVRPAWPIWGYDYFPGAKGNVLRGMLPSDKFSKSDSFTLVLYDEFGEYDKLGPGVDKKAHDAAESCSKVRITQGTIPEGGGPSSHFKLLCDKGNTQTQIHMDLDWSDIGNYMVGAFYSCEKCNPNNPIVDTAPATGLLSPYGKPLPGPGPNGVVKTCVHCGHKQLVTRRNVSSPHFERVKERNNYDPVALARYYHRDWYASVGDRAFYTFSRAKAVRSLNVAPGAEPLHEHWYSIDGFDPGWNVENPAAWVLIRFSDVLMVPRLVAWYMAAQRTTDWWVPFLKRWSPAEMTRKRILRGPDAGALWTDAHYYSEEERIILERISRIRFGRDDAVEGDKYGSHQGGVGYSEYDILDSYGVTVRYEYVKDRMALIGKARDIWLPRLVIDPEIADYRPPAIGGVACPSITDCFDSARMRTSKSGQGEATKDIDKNNPRHVSHPVDAFLYACRSMPDEVRAMSDLGGEFGIVAAQEPQVVKFGEIFEGQF